MNIELYFEPVDFDKFQKGKKFPKYTLGFQIERDTKKFSTTGRQKISCVLIGVPDDRRTPNKGSAKAPAEIRKHLYGLSNFDTTCRIADLGNLKTGKTDNDIYFALRDVVDYLREEGIVTIVLGGGQDLSIGIARAFRGVKDFTMTIADARADVKTSRDATSSSNFITRVLKENPGLFHLELIGIQSHYLPPAIMEFLREQTFEGLQLGKMRDDFTLAEPVLRNSHFLSFDMCVVRQSDASGHYMPSPNGFYAEEACQLARYAGLSNRLSVFGLFEVNPSYEKSGNTAALAAQMVWYFLEGALHRRKEDPAANKDAFVRYFVEMEDMGEALVFYHQPSTNRWWIEIFPEEGESWIIACRDEDYRKAILKEIPEICWKYVRKTDRWSKY
jgi:formiminoglutamase